MKKLKLNEDFGKVVEPHDYELDPTEQYYICLENELEQQKSILNSVQIMGLTALEDYQKWLMDNGFDADFPNPTNDFVASYFGVKELWKTNLSQGIVVKNEGEDDYYIVMECSRQNPGHKYTQIILTLGGCL